MAQKENIDGSKTLEYSGAQSAAFKKANINYEVVGISEWFINALLAYDAIHYGDKPFETDLTTKQKRAYLKHFKFSKDSVNECNLDCLLKIFQVI